jgi:hypothetical protein
MVAERGEDGVARWGRGERAAGDGAPFITVRGGREEMGEQLGVLLGPELRAAFVEVERLKADIRAYAWYLGPIVDWALLGPIADDMERRIPEEYLAELRGVARGSGIPYRELLFACGGMGTLEFGCTSIAARRGTRALHGRNLDWAPGWLGDMPVVIRYEPEGARASMVASSVALCNLALTGLNDAGISISINIVSYDRKKEAAPEPLWYLTRRALENAESLDGVDELLIPYRTDIGWLVTAVSAREGEGAIYELSTIGVSKRHMEEGDDRSLFALNGYASEDLSKALTPATIPTNPDVDDRAAYQERYAAEGGRLDVEAMLRWLTDDEYAGFRPWIGFESRCHSGSIQTAVMDGANGKLYLGSGAGWAGWSTIEVFSFGEGREPPYREAKDIRSDPAFLRLLKINAYYFQDLYGGRHRRLFDELDRGLAGTGWPIRAQLMLQIALRYPGDVDRSKAAAALEECRARYGTQAQFALGLAKLASLAGERERAEAFAREALGAPSLELDQELAALELLADSRRASGDPRGAGDYAARCLAILDRLAARAAFIGPAAELKAKMEGYLAAANRL